MRDPLKETRRHPRFTVDVEATVHATSGGALVARTRDVSRTGICLITTTPIGVGTPLAVELVLSFGETRSEPLRMQARVVWCTSIERAFQVGAMFDELDDQQESFLEMFLQYLDGTLAPRADLDDVGAEPEVEMPAPVPPDIKDDPFRK